MNQQQKDDLIISKLYKARAKGETITRINPKEILKWVEETRQTMENRQ